MTPTRQPSSIVHAPRPSLATSDYAALRDFVDRAAQGEIDLRRPAPDTSLELPLPSGWYASAPPPPPAKAMRPEARAAAFGLGAGLLVLVPFALWSQMGQSMPKTDGAVFVNSFASTGAEPARDAAVTRTAVDVVPVRTLSTTAAAGDPTIEAALQLIKTGDVIGARTLLSTAAAARNPAALFVMAETYDPNMLAAWGARGVGADAERARALYAAAQALGHEKAAGRLQSLR